MEFLKKHYEKIALAMVSVLLIVTALTLMGTFEPKGDGGPMDDRRNVSAAKPLDTDELKAIAQLLKDPPPWTGTGRPPFASEVWNWDGTKLVRAGEETGPVEGNPLDDLDWTVSYRTFPMIFMAVSEVGTNKIFQINIANAGTRFVKLRDVFKQAIYGGWEQFQVLGYEEKKSEKRKNPKTGGWETVNLSVLTLQRKSGSATKNIPLTMGQTQFEREPVGHYYSTITGESSGELKRGSVFPYKSKQYELLDISPQQVVIKQPDSKIYRKPPRRVVQR